MTYHKIQAYPWTLVAPSHNKVNLELFVFFLLLVFNLI